MIIDPGLGFGKSVKHNYVILNKLSEFLDLNCPILIGSSRKSFIGKTLGSNSNRLFGTAATIAISILKVENPTTKDAEGLAWCKEYKPNLSYEECSNEFGY